MLFNPNIVAAWAAVISFACVTAAPTYPLMNGFPNPDADAIVEIETSAGGPLSNSSPPPSISEDGLTSLKLIAFNELVEVAFFSALIFNITNENPGYNLSSTGIQYDNIIDNLNTILNQEELHLLMANDALADNNVSTIKPCEYIFPVDSLNDSIALAATFTDIVLGTLQDIQTIFANNDDNQLIAGVGAVIGNEGQQSGFYRNLLGKSPAAAPFLTGGARDFAFTAISAYTINGSCPNVDTIPLTVFPPLEVMPTSKSPEAIDEKLVFYIPGVFDSNSTGAYNTSTGQTALYSIAYLSGQNLPVVSPLFEIHEADNGTYMTANFPFVTNQFSNGLTIAAFVNNSGPFADAEAVAAATLYGPAIIELD